MEGLAALVDPILTEDDLLALVLKTGQMGVETMALKNKIIEAVKSGTIKRFVVMAGCDSRHKTRDYYTQICRGFCHLMLQKSWLKNLISRSLLPLKKMWQP